jgi:hypothetical protein
MYPEMENHGEGEKMDLARAILKGVRLRRLINCVKDITGGN